MKMAKIVLPKRSGKRSKVREKSLKSQGILKRILSGNPALAVNYITFTYGLICGYLGSSRLHRCLTNIGS